MNGLERMHKALKVEEPDRVPHFEFLVDKKVRNAIKPGLSNEDFHVYMDIDGIGYRIKVPLIVILRWMRPGKSTATSGVLL